MRFAGSIKCFDWLSYRFLILVAPQRLHRNIVTSFPNLESNCFSWSIAHLWNPLRHKVLPLCLSPGRGFLKGKMSAIDRFTSEVIVSGDA